MLLWFIGLAGCSNLERVVVSDPGNPTTPNWELRHTIESMQFFQGQGLAEDPQRQAQSMAFVASRLEDLQHVTEMYREQQHRLLKSVSVEVDNGIELKEGIDTWSYAHSDSGQISITSIQPASFEPAPWQPAKAAIARHPLTVQQLRSLRQHGAALIIIVGSLDLRPSNTIVGGLLILQITESGWFRLTGMTIDELDQWLTTSESLDLPSSVTVGVDIQFADHHDSVLVLVPGKDPTYADELVIVCAVLESDRTDGWLAPATVMELARHYTRWSDLWLFPRRTMLFAIWRDRDSLINYLNRPYWPLDATHNILHVGLDSTKLDGVNTLLSNVHPIDLPNEEVGEVELMYHRRVLDMVHKIIVREGEPAVPVGQRL